MDYLMTAVQDNDAEKLRQMIRNRKKVRAKSEDPSKPSNSTYDFLQNACIAAAESNCIAALGVALDEGGTIDADIIGAASHNGCFEVFEFLIARGWDVNQELGLSGDALIIATSADNLDIVIFLLAHGADPNANLRNGRHTPLECAVLSSLSIMKALIVAGAEIQGHSALQMAACYGRVDHISYLLDCGALIDEVPNSVYRCALSEAALNGNVQALKLLVDRDAEPDVRDRNGQTALELAMMYEHKVCIDILREASGLLPLNHRLLILRGY